jgi:hypothetical protein
MDPLLTPKNVFVQKVGGEAKEGNYLKKTMIFNEKIFTRPI